MVPITEIPKEPKDVSSAKKVMDIFTSNGNTTPRWNVMMPEGEFHHGH